MNDQTCLSARGLTRRSGRTAALDGLSFSIPTGQIVGLLGRNGAGKSTLLRIISGQLKPTSGRAELFGGPIYDRAETLGRLCLIGDTPDFGKLRNAKAFLSVCAGLFPHWNRDEALRLVSRFDLPMRKPLKGFSRGMQTALMLTAGLASGAELTVFDEPSLGLDAVMRERFYDELLDAHKRNEGRTFLLSTHLIDEVTRTLDSAVMIDKGRLLCEGSLSELTLCYLSVSGTAEAVCAATEGQTVLKEEDMAGSLIRHLRLNAPEDAERIAACEGIQAARMNLQRLFVFLTEEKEAQRNDPQ